MSSALRLFGGASLLVDDQPFAGAAAQPRRLAVLAILAEAWPSPVSRDRLIGLIWPEQDDAGARRLLTQALYEVRRELGPVVVAGSGRDLVLDASAIDVDLIAFRAAAREGDAGSVVALHRGAFLDGFHLRDAAEFERWTSAAREETVRTLRTALDGAIQRDASAGNYKRAAQWAERALDVAPHDAALVVETIGLLERAGDPGSAMRIAATYERRMRDDLELPPDAEVARRAASVGAAMLEPVRATSAVPDIVIPSHHSDAPRPAPRRFPFILAAAAAGVATPAAALGLRSARGSTERAAIVVAPFDAGGDSASARIARTITPLLVANLDDAGEFDVDTIARDGSSARRLTGIVAASGDGVRIDASLPALPGEDEVHASVSGSRDSIPALVERLSIALLPTLYPTVNPVVRREGVRTIRSSIAARAYLDGESALNRAAYDTAYDAFRVATREDSANAYLWYRRAVAAEEMHHLDDANRSAALADSMRGPLASREAQLVHAYAVWRTGDTRAADSLYRAILESRPSDPEAWFQFAEVSYHGGPLIGHPLDAARDPWRRAVALDSNNFPALMHAIRLEARAADDASLEALLARAEAIKAREPYLSEARAIAAAHKTSLTRADVARLAAMPDASLQFVSAIVASFVERPDLSREAAQRLVEPSRPDAVRSGGQTALAYLAMTRGDVDGADAMLDSLGARDNVAAALSRSYLAALPFLPADSARANEAARRLAGVAPRATGSPLYLELSVDASAAPIIQRYDAALLDLRRNARANTSLGCTAGDRPEQLLCADLERGLAAEQLMREGKDAQALATLEHMSLRAPYQLSGRSLYYARTRERFLRAQLLERAGRLDEAYDWYASVPYLARLDYVYLGASHLGRGRIRERQGAKDQASAHYRRAVELWVDADAAFQPMRDEASAGLRRVTTTTARR